MTIYITITLCVLLIVAYVFDITSSKTKIPSVILLLALGFAVRRFAIFTGFEIPDLSPILSELGTIGLILIVLEGALELELKKEKSVLIRKSLWVAAIPMLALSFVVAYLFYRMGDYSYKNCIANAIPFSVISSSIAIPTVMRMKGPAKEFVIYESSLSDIFGVLFFNFIVFNAVINFAAFGNFILQLLIMIVISFIATSGLSFLLSKVSHNIKYIPIIVLIILIYSVSKIFHLPALVFILTFGLFLGNLDELVHLKIMRKLHPENLQAEVSKFNELAKEMTFLVRTLFFLLFGFLIRMNELINPESLILATYIVAGIFIMRAIALKLAGVKLQPILFLAPRGLITILLFLSIPASQVIDFVNRSLLIQVIVLTSLTMIFGKESNEELHNSKDIKTSEAIT
jgi:potassium/hydrogen antiporter